MVVQSFSRELGARNNVQATFTFSRGWSGLHLASLLRGNSCKAYTKPVSISSSIFFVKALTPVEHPRNCHVIV